MIELFAFLFGISIGSFLTVCIYRLPEGRSIVHPPSHCESCGYRLRPIDLIPVVSALMLRGRCRSCGASFSMRHVFVELLNGILYALIAHVVGITAAGVMSMLFASYMLVIAFIDLDHRRILNSMILFGLVFFAGYQLAAPFVDEWLGLLPRAVDWSGRLLWMAGLLGVAALAALLPKRFQALGLGDLKLCIVLALVYGRATWIVLALTVVLAAAVATLLCVLKKMSWRGRIPMGPFFAASVMLISVCPVLLPL